MGKQHPVEELFLAVGTGALSTVETASTGNNHVCRPIFFSGKKKKGLASSLLTVLPLKNNK